MVTTTASYTPLLLLLVTLLVRVRTEGVVGVEPTLFTGHHQGTTRNTGTTTVKLTLSTDSEKTHPEQTTIITGTNTTQHVLTTDTGAGKAQRGQDIITSKDGDFGITSPPPSITVASLTSLCAAQCTAKCLDAQLYAKYITNEIDELYTAKMTCNVVCLRYESTAWVEHCQNNTACLERCHDLKNQTASEGNEPSIPLVSIQQTTPDQVTLSWPQMTSISTIFYVIESSDDQGHTWRFLAKTPNASLTVELNVCARRMYRVAAVSRHGSRGFNADSTVYRQHLPIPGPVRSLKVISKTYDRESRYFFVTVTWEPPEAWKAQHIRTYQVFGEMQKWCEDTLVPAVPRVDVIRQLDGSNHTMMARIRVFFTGYGCIYETPLKAITNCNVPGQPVFLEVDLTDCDEISGLPCPTDPPMHPGTVTNVTCHVNNDTLTVTITWVPPPRRVDVYIIQWGMIVPNSEGTPASSIVELGRRHLPGNETETEIQVNSSSAQYGIKILPTVKGIPFEEKDLSMSSLVLKFRIEPKREYGENGNGNTETPGPTIENASQRDLLSVYIGVPLGVVMVLLVVAASIHQRERLRRVLRAAPRKDDELYKLDEGKSGSRNYLVDNPLYTSSDPWEIPRQRLHLGEVLGRGAFGQVVEGELYDTCSLHRTSAPESEASTKVAVKMLLEGADDILTADFEREISLMKTIGAHSNVVSMLGCCTQGAPLCLVVEHMNTDLLHFLRRHRSNSSLAAVTEEDRLCLKDLLSFARQIAIGMEYLSQRGFVHRDLATRNVLVGDRKTVKIGDFGLTRYVYDDHVYVTRRGKRLPLKWMAIEAIFDLVFTTQTDVWAYGVLLYELVTLGGVPYPTVSNKDLLRRLQAGYRLERPDTCPVSLYKRPYAPRI